MLCTLLKLYINYYICNYFKIGKQRLPTNINQYSIVTPFLSLFFNHFLGHSIRISECKIFVNFAKKKNLLFLFYIPIFTKQPYQFVYSTHLFNKIFIFTHHQRSIYIHYQPTPPPPSTHPATIIKHQHQPPSSATIINPPSSTTITLKPTDQTKN